MLASDFRRFPGAPPATEAVERLPQWRGPGWSVHVAWGGATSVVRCTEEVVIVNTKDWPRNEALLEAALCELKAVFGDQFSTSPVVREQHGKDMTYHPALPPDAVVFAASTEDVQRVAMICSRYDVPMIPYGAGTSLEGHIGAPLGGVSVDLSRMDRILELNEADMDVTVEPGVTREDLNSYLRDTGLFFPIDPGAHASIGGMASTRASGTNAVRYGTMRDNVLGLGVVLPDGTECRTGTRARKSSAGYDLTRLFVGSEGTLGFLTSITLRLYGIPECISAAACPFESLAGAVDTAIETIQLGIPVARIEFLDDVQIDAVNRHSKLDLPVKNTLFLEFHGTEASVAEQTETVRSLALANGGGDFQWATQTDHRSKLWQARHEALWAAKELRPGADAWISDVCVPISRLAECVRETKKDIVANNMLAPIVGHVGDGNFHVLFLIDLDDPSEVGVANALNKRMIERALAMGGTCTGEHGIGIGKVDSLLQEMGGAVDVMRNIKQAVDPKNIMNPGKIFAEKH